MASNLHSIRVMGHPFLCGGDVTDSVSGAERGTPLWLIKAQRRSTPMPQRAATIVSLPMAFEVVKAMQGDNLEWGEDYRPLARQAVAEIIEDEMAQAVDRYLDQLSLEDGPDRRNGYYPRHL